MLEWSEFARHLGRELAVLERDTILIVRERDESRHYVQAMREPDRLYAEAVSNNFLDGPLLLTLADEEVMSEAGWRPPAEPSPRNWWTELPESGTGIHTVTPGDYARLADVMVTALRDVQGVRRPSDLVYESFHRHGSGLIELLDFGIEAADPSRISMRRRSVIENVTAPAMDPEELEVQLTEAKQRADHATYFQLLLAADLVLPATGAAVEDPEYAEFPTTTIGSGTYLMVFTSPQALARSVGDRAAGLYRRSSFGQLAAAWPDPTWQLAINAGLPSEVHLDATAVTRLASQRPTALPPAAAPAVAPPEQPPVPSGRPGASAMLSAPIAPEPKPGSVPPNPAQLGQASPGAPQPGAAFPGAPQPGPPFPEAPQPGSPIPEAARPRSAFPETPQPGAGTPGSGSSPGSGPGPGPGPGPSQLGSVSPAPAQPGLTPQGPMSPGASSPGPVAPEPAPPPGAVLSGPVVPVRAPQGTRLWRWNGEGDENERAVPVAVYDAIGGSWTPVRTDAVPAPWTE
ncbi:TY-Chap domain-containing protein [Actinomadura rudentiformis]|uniref:TY-Chap domain-containing protein n=1 Tax=Actinomadura rudentiformis TaxID=359158 RepID=UPI0021F4B9EF|nr:SseB family protein [Actinomadura rudentiformis]